MNARTGWTLLEAAIVLCVLGTVLAVFVPTFLTKLRTSRVAEATTNLAELERRLAAYYDTAEGDAGGRRAKHCLPVATGPVPADIPHGSVSPDFGKADDPATAGFRSIGFAPKDPVRYRYSFEPRMAGCGLDGHAAVTVRAEGDLDHDGRHALFEATLADRGGKLVPVGVLRVVDRLE